LLIVPPDCSCTPSCPPVIVPSLLIAALMSDSIPYGSVALMVPAAVTVNGAW